MKLRVTWVSIVTLGVLILGLSLGQVVYESDSSDGGDSDGDSDYAMAIHPAPAFNS